MSRFGKALTRRYREIESTARLNRFVAVMERKPMPLGGRLRVNGPANAMTLTLRPRIETQFAWLTHLNT
jgi:hypothetical protein